MQLLLAAVTCTIKPHFVVVQRKLESTLYYVGAVSLFTPLVFLQSLLKCIGFVTSIIPFYSLIKLTPGSSLKFEAEYLWGLKCINYAYWWRWRKILLDFEAWLGLSVVVFRLEGSWFVFGTSLCYIVRIKKGSYLLYKQLLFFVDALCF